MTLPALPSGIFQPTTPPDQREQGGEPVDDAPKAPKPRKKKATTTATDESKGEKLYLTADVKFRLRMLAFKRGAKISAVANEVLDKALPRWTLERTE